MTSLRRAGCFLLAALFFALGPADAVAQQQDPELPGVVSTPAGFEATLFAAPPNVSYPTVITADGTTPGALFVGVDKNGSLDQERGRGQVMHVQDTDGDGQADRFTSFVDSVDSPRGLTYDGETLYVMHPPTLTAYRDTDGDGRADEAKNLIRGLGFGLDFRGADHTTNGINMGIDGWIYIAVGDYGFIDAEGADGTRLTHRGGGIVRVRPDGSEMEIVASGLRNVYDIALDPYLNGFVRGNTNDGEGWRVRLNRIVLGADYGYPSLFKHFSDEVMPPLADYGGGSGTGAYFLQEPGLPDSLNFMLYTVDWGRSAVYRHPRQRKGARFLVEQEPFMKISAPTDMTVDGRSQLYVSSWFRGGFRYTGENVGFIAQLTPSGPAPSSLAQPAEADTEALMRLLGSKSRLHRLQAQREILRREAAEPFGPALEAMAASDEEPLYARVAALFTLKQLQGPDSHDFLLQQARQGQAIQAFALRALADRKSQLEGVPAEPFVQALGDTSQPRAQLEAVTGLARLDAREAAAEILPLTASEDPVLSHIAVQALADLRATEAALQALAGGAAPEVRRGALRVLKQLHTEAAVEGLIAALEDTQDPGRRQPLLEVLARLYHQEGDWTREDWWGTQPSTLGPYYNPVTWAQSETIKPVLYEALQEATGPAADTLLATYERNRVVPVGATALLQEAARQSDTLNAALTRALIGQQSAPAAAVPLLERVAGQNDSLQARTVRMLAAQPDRLPPEGLPLLRRASLDEALPAALRREALTTLGAGRHGPVEAARAFAALGDPNALPEDLAETWRRFAQRAEHVESVGYFTELARSGAPAEQTLAYVVLLNIAHADDEGEDEPSAAQQAAQQKARAAIEAGWSAPEQTAPLLRAIGYAKSNAYADRVRALLREEGQPDRVRQAAAFAAKRIGLGEAPGGASSSSSSN